MREAPAFAETLLGFPWLADGVTEDESYAVHHLQGILQKDPAVGEALLSFPWIADGVTKDERNAVYDLGEILREAPAIAETLLRFPWFANGLTEDESQAIYDLQEIVRENPDVAETLLIFSWLADGVNEDESYAIYNLRKISKEVPAVAKTLLSFPWIADGLSQNESRALRGFRGLYEIDSSRLSALTRKPWFKDGLSYEEFRLVGDLGNLARRSEADFLAIIDMPFLKTLDPADFLAVNSLSRLTSCSDDRAYFSLECSESEPDGVRVSKKFRQAMSHPTISGGISDEEAKIVATLFSARRYNPDIFEPLLDPDTVTLEERTIDLPHTGETPLTIIRIRTGSERTMDLLERAVRDVEGFMGTPLPVRHVIYLAENTVAGGAANAWSNLNGIHEMDTDEIPEVDTLHVLAHETAHWYWGHYWSRHWVAEGLATFFQSFTRTQAEVDPGVPVVPIWRTHWPPCPIHSNIAELEKLDREEGVISYCSNSFGERLARDLWRTLGDSVFREGLANLYLTARSGAPVGGCEKVMWAGMCEVGTAFKAAAPADEAATVDKVLGRWFDNSEPYDISHLDTSPPNSSLPDGVKITQAYISLDEDRPEVTRTDSFSADEIWERVFLNLHFSFPAVQQERELPITVVEHYEDGLPYRIINRTHTLHSGRTQMSRSYLVGAGPGYTWRIRNDAGADRSWRPGRYWVYVYSEGQKVAEVEFEVTP